MPPGGSEEPGEVEDPDALERKRLAVRRRAARAARSRGAAGALALARRLGEHGLGVFAKQRRPPPDLPARRGREPFAGAIAQRSAKLRVIDVGEAAALKPVLVERALVRLAQRRPEQTRPPEPRATACCRS